MDMVAMGKYGVFVWSSIALTIAIVLFNEWAARRRHRVVFRDVEVRLKATEGRQ